jgi:hypothetical protein
MLCPPVSHGAMDMRLWRGKAEAEVAAVPV